MTLTAGARLGPYEIVALIGSGGMGEVYRATDTRLARTVAVKVLPAHLSERPEARERFEREARAISSLNHPHICALYDVGQQDGVSFLVMEYLEGDTLGERVAKGALPLEQAVEYGVQIASALDKAHSQGISHRDLKPGNIMLTKSGAKLLDFGLAKLREPARGGDALATMSRALTERGTVLGTFQYMAPEQLQGQEADARSDIFAFGSVLYEMVTGQKAFQGKSHASLVAAILDADPAPLPPRLAGPLEHVIRTCLTRDPDERWQTARDLMLELKWIAGGPAAGPAAVAAPAAGLPRRWAAATALLALALAALAVLYFRRPQQNLDVVRFPVPAPEKSGFSPFGSVAVSPDGRRLAFSATTPDGKLLLFVRSLDSLTQPLPGTEGANSPFWSPDSRFVGFSVFTEGKLKKVEVTGGPPQTLCDAAQALGGTWNREGVIVFGHLNAPLHRVAAAGGPATPVTELDASRKETSHVLPHFLPDGRHFLYVARTNQQGGADIYVAALDSKERKRLLGADSNAVYAGGHLLFLRERTLLAQAFDAGRRELTGDPVPVAEQVGVSFGRGNFSASETGVLAYGGGSGGNRHLAWFDRTGKPLAVAGPPAGYNDLNLSPDQTRVAAAVLDRQGGFSDVWLLDLARGTSSRFTFDPAGDSLPVWAPDGSRIAFTTSRDGPANIYQKVSSGAGNDEPLLKSDAGKSLHDWSRDGRFLVYSQVDPKTKRDLWVLPLFGDRKPMPYLRAEFDESHAQFSPDGRWMAYVSNETGASQVYVQPFPASGGKWQISTAGGSQPRWRRDGKELFYLSLDAKLMAVPIQAGATLQPGIPNPLFQSSIAGAVSLAFSHRWAAAADGQRFLFINAAEEATSTPLTVVLNWTATLRR